MKILVIDNYDSFTYNLVQLLGINKVKFLVKRNDSINENFIYDYKPDKILISPGPGRPEDSNFTLDAIKRFGSEIPILGVCLGHQAIGYVYGAQVINAKSIMHGKTSEITHDGKTIFKNIPQKFIATRYHSLIVDEKSLPQQLEASAFSEDNTIMAIRHKSYPVEGIQFHPESILTSEGINIIKNWIKL